MVQISGEGGRIVMALGPTVKHVFQVQKKKKILTKLFQMWKNSHGSGSNSETCLSGAEKEKDPNKALSNVEEGKKEDSNCDKTNGQDLRLVHNQVLVNMAKDIRPPPVDGAEDMKSPKVK